MPVQSSRRSSRRPRCSPAPRPPAPPTCCCSTASSRRSAAARATASSTSTASCACRRHDDQAAGRLHRPERRAAHVLRRGRGQRRLHRRPLAHDPLREPADRRPRASTSPPGSGTVRNGGALTLEGAQVAVGGDVNTSGSGGGTSGPVSITSAGALSVGARHRLRCPGPPRRGRRDRRRRRHPDAGHGTRRRPTPARTQIGGPVTIASSGGDVRVSGDVSTSGRDAPANAGAGLGGGVGAAVAISGSDVRVGRLDTTGGSSADAERRPVGPIVTSRPRGAARARDASTPAGRAARAPAPCRGTTITASAGGPLVIAGGACAGGGQALARRLGRRQITLQGRASTPDAVRGRRRTPRPRPRRATAGPAAAITVTAGGRRRSDPSRPTAATRRPAPRPGPAARSPSPARRLDRHRPADAHGGSPAAAPAPRRPDRAVRADDLDVAGALASSGANANGAVAPSAPGRQRRQRPAARGGGHAERSATTCAPAAAPAPRTSDGGPPAAIGGAGGRIDVVARALGSIVAISTHGGAGGDYGDDQGPGGAGGADPRLDRRADLRRPARRRHRRRRRQPARRRRAPRRRSPRPSAPAVTRPTALLSFTSRSPDAEGYRVLRSVAGGAPDARRSTTTATSGIKRLRPACTPVTFTVVAFHTGVGWTSDAPAAGPLRPAALGHPEVRRPAGAGREVLEAQAQAAEAAPRQVDASSVACTRAASAARREPAQARKGTKTLEAGPRQARASPARSQGSP